MAPGRTGAFQRLAAPRGAVAQVFGNINPTLTAQLRATWEAINNAWTQKVLNYTQGQQLKLLQDAGFESPSWEDLSYILIGIIVLASAVGGAWTLWEKSQHDPWLRLLARARKQLARRGIDSDDSTTPRQLARQVLAKHGPQAQAIHDWLLGLELQRYGARPESALTELKRQFQQLAWPN